MLDIQLSIASITANRETATLSDLTVYGGANPARSTVGCYPLVQFMSVNTTVADTVATTSDTGSPQTAASWSFNVSGDGDGWWRILFIAPEDYDVAETYDQFDVVQDPATNIVYQSKVGSNVGNALVNTSYWEVTTPLVALAKGTASEAQNLASTVYSVVLTMNAEFEYGNAISDASSLCCSEDCQLEELFVYIKLGALLDGAYVDGDRANYPASIPKLERIESIVESLS